MGMKHEKVKSFFKNNLKKIFKKPKTAEIVDFIHWAFFKRLLIFLT